MARMASDGHEHTTKTLPPFAYEKDYGDGIVTDEVLENVLSAFAPLTDLTEYK